MLNQETNHENESIQHVPKTYRQLLDEYHGGPMISKEDLRNGFYCGGVWMQEVEVQTVVYEGPRLQTYGDILRLKRQQAVAPISPEPQGEVIAIEIPQQANTSNLEQHYSQAS